MAIDFDAIRKKLGQISGQNKKSNITWRPEEGKEYQIRIISFPNNDGSPFIDRWYYYGIGGEKAASILAPSQFGKPDPIQDLITKLREDNTPESRELCKKLYPKMRTTAAVIVRGEEDKGVRHWSFGKNIYQDLLNLMLDSDYGDITDPDTGRDLMVICTKDPKKSFADTKFTPRPVVTPLSKDQAQAKQWLNNIPAVSDYDVHLTPEQIEKRVNDWLNPPKKNEEAPAEEEEEAPVKKPTKKVVVEEEEEEEEAPVKKPTKKPAPKEEEDPFVEFSKPKNKAKKSTSLDELNDAFSELED